jgi:hypothetical protein
MNINSIKLHSANGVRPDQSGSFPERIPSTMRDYPLSTYIDELSKTTPLLLRLSADTGVELSPDGSGQVLSWESQLPAPYAKFVPAPAHVEHAGHLGKQAIGHSANEGKRTSLKCMHTSILNILNSIRWVETKRVLFFRKLILFRDKVPVYIFNRANSHLSLYLVAGGPTK